MLLKTRVRHWDRRSIPRPPLSGLVASNGEDRFLYRIDAKIMRISLDPAEPGHSYLGW
jgi:hypothetical protein